MSVSTVTVHWRVRRRKSIPMKPLIIAVFVLLAVVATPSLSLADEGSATWYGQPFHGRTMYNGQVFDMYDPTTTACNIYPLGTWIKVTNPANGNTVVVQVRDRGRFTHAVDLSYAAFAALDDPAKMMIRVVYEVVSGPEAATDPAASPEQTTAPPAPISPAAPDAVPNPVPDPVIEQAASPTKYFVAAGDSLVRIAERFGLDVADLIAWNSLSDADLLLIGQRLVLRASDGVEGMTVSSRGADLPSGAQAAGNGLYVVVEGDTLWSIAEKYGTTPEHLAELNGLGDTDTIVIGDALRVPGASAGETAQAGVNGVHTVVEGDTLWSIAEDYGTSPEALAELNGLDETSIIVIGQSLSVPGTAGEATKAAPRRYVVEEGDTLLGIALGHDTTVEALMLLNRLDDSENIQIGQVLVLP